MNVWDGVDRLIAGATDLDGLHFHGLHLLAANRWRALGRSVPLQFLEEERRAAAAALAAHVVLTKVRTALSGPIVLFKGPEVAVRYPDPALRPFADVDLLVPAAAQAQAALLQAGFQVANDERTHVEAYHLPALRWPDLPLLVEIHSAPWWLDWMAPPTNEELFAAAVPGTSGVDGILTLPPSYHALLLAAHSWLHTPLRRLLDLVDVAAMSDGIASAELDALARRWGMGRVWATTTRAVDDLLLDTPTRSWSARLWARHLGAIREPTVLERVLTRWLSDFSALPPHAALRVVAEKVRHDVQPPAGGAWRDQFARIRRTAGAAFAPASEHRAKESVLREGTVDPASPRCETDGDEAVRLG